MKIGLLHDIVRWEEKAIAKAITDTGNEPVMIDTRKMEMDFGSKIIGPECYLQRSVSYFRGLHTTAFLEAKGKFVVNNLHSMLITGNKMLTSLALVKNNVPTPETGAAVSSGAAMSIFQKKFNGRAVLKPVIGSWGRMIALLNDRYAADAVFEDRDYMHPINSVYYLQEFVEKPGRDIRLFVVGDKVVGGIYRYSEEGQWKTNTAIGGRAEKLDLTNELEKLALKAADSVGRGVYGVDIMESEKGYLVHEINGTSEFKSTAKATGKDIAKEIVEFVIKDAEWITRSQSIS
jgi:[lysine-biosynthesis-protein LysW]--L-2-aminoadipate ligase